MTGRGRVGARDGIVLGTSTVAGEPSIARDARLISEAAKIRFFPFVPVRGEGSWLWDESGRRLLDFTAGWAVANTGYGDPAVRAAVEAQLAQGAYAGLVSAVIKPALDLADRLVELVPCTGLAKVWFGHSGSDANECVARLVPRATGRRRMISFVGSYHGSTDGAAALSGHTAQARYAGSATSTKVPYPDAYRPQFAHDPLEDERAILRHLEEYVLASISPAGETAAIMLEAVQSDGGDLAPSPEFLRGIEAICRRHGILLVLDEVKVGLGRTGDWFGFTAAGVTPDLVVLGKSLGGGLPLSAVVGRAEVLDVDPALALFTTGGNPYSTAAGSAVLKSIEQRELIANARAVGGHLEVGIRNLAASHRLIGDVRGRGMIRGIELVTDRETREPAAQETAKVCLRAAELGLAVFYVGLRSNVIEVTPPLSLSVAEADLGLEILDRALTDVEAGRVSDEATRAYTGW